MSFDPALPVVLKDVPAPLTMDGASLRIKSDTMLGAGYNTDLMTGVSLLAAIRAALRHNGLRPSLANRRCSVWVSDSLFSEPYEVPFREWNTFMIRPGMRIHISPKIRGGGGGKNPLNTLLSIVVIAAAAITGAWVAGLPIFSTSVAGAFGPMMPGALAGFGAMAGGLASSAFLLGGMMLVSAIAPMSTPKLSTPGSLNAEKNWSIDGTQNKADLYGVFPLILGKVRFAPRLAARYYTYLRGNNQYARYLYVVGGRCRVSNMRIGDTDLLSFRNVDYRVHENWRGEDLELFPNAVIQEDIGVTLTNSGGYYTRTTTLDCTEIQFEIYCSRGMIRVKANGDRYDTWVSFDAEYRQVGTEEWIGFFDTTAIKRGTVYAPTPSPSATGGATSIGFSIYADSNGVPNLNGGTLLGSGTSTSTWTLVSTGDSSEAWQVVSTSVTATVLPGVDTTFTVSGTAITVAAGGEIIPTSDFSISGRTATPFRRGYSRKVPKGQYEFRLRRRTADANANDTENTVLNDTIWSAFRSIQSGPAIVYDGAPYTVIEMDIQATEQLSGHISEFNAYFESYCPAWNGEEWVEEPSNNPAALGMLLATSSHVRRHIPPNVMDTIDLPAWQEFYEWCEEHGWAYNAVQTAEERVREVLHNILASARGSVAFNGTLFSVVWDHLDKEVAYPFGPRNSWGFSMRKEFVKEQPHGVRVLFLNETRDFQEDERIVYADGYSHATATNIVQVEFDGVTDPDLIYKHARLRLAESIWRPAAYELSTDFAYMNVQRGLRIAVSHDVPMWGLKQARVVGCVYAVYDYDTLGIVELTAIALRHKAEISPESTQEAFAAMIAGMDAPALREMLSARPYIQDTDWVQGLILDDHVSMVGEKNYALTHFRAPGNTPSFSVRSEPVTTNTVYFQTDIPAASAPFVGGLIHFGESARESRDCIVTGVEIVDNSCARITFQDYSATQIYAALTGEIPPWDSGISIPSRWELGKPAAPIVEAIHTDESVLDRSADGILFPRIQIVFSVPERANVDVETVRIQIRESGGGNAWRDAGSAPARSGFVYATGVTEGISYDLRLYSVSTLGVVSNFSPVYNSITVIGRTTPPPAPLRINIDGNRIWWEMPEDSPIDIRGWEVWMGFDAEDSFFYAKRISNPHTVLMEFDLAAYAGTARRVWVRTVDDIGLVSDLVSVALNLGNVIVDNLVFEIQENADRGWPGRVEDGSISGIGLVPDSQESFWRRESFWQHSRFWQSDMTASMVYTSNYHILGEAEYSYLSLDISIPYGTIASIEYRFTSSGEFWTRPLFWNVGNFWAFDVESAWHPMPDKLWIDGPRIIEVRVTTVAGSPGVIPEITWRFDVEDEVEYANNVEIPATGLRIPVTRTFRFIKNIASSVEFTGSDVSTAAWVDKGIIENGFVVEGPFMYCLDSMGNQVPGVIDVTMQGAKGVVHG